MENYIAEELQQLVCTEFPLDRNSQGVMGHSMGGHGALTLALKYPELYKSVSAFSPIVAPSQVPWGHKAFSRYLGNDETEWAKHDACALMQSSMSRKEFPAILIDQGLDDQFLIEQLKPELFKTVCKQVEQNLTLRLHEGYDHSYYFIHSFIGDHIAHHANILAKSS
jgi:S-formylglutathione hydrolase